MIGLKKCIISTLGLIALWFSIWVLFSWTIVDMTNRTFMVGLISLTIYVILKIIQSGFLNLFFSGMQRVKGFLFRRSNVAAEIDERLKEDVQLQQFKERAYGRSLMSTLTVALASLVMSLIGLVLFYT